MSSIKHGKIEKYEDIFIEKHKDLPTLKIQKAEYEDKTKAINIFRFLTVNNKRQGLIVIPLSYSALSAIIKGLIDLYGKTKVEKELGIKIK